MRRRDTEDIKQKRELVLTHTHIFEVTDLDIYRGITIAWA
jgi:hypothetical protein